MAAANANVTVMKGQLRKMAKENTELKESFRAEREQAID